MRKLFSMMLVLLALVGVGCEPPQQGGNDNNDQGNQGGGNSGGGGFEG